MIEPVKRIYLSTHEPLAFHFVPSPATFRVDEVLGFEPSKKGAMLLLKIEKTYLSTWELLDHLMEKLGATEEELGYAGLKDKYATTTQYISLPRSYAPQLKYIEDKNVKILETHTHHERLKIGDLAGNRFRIVLEKVTPIMAGKLQKAFGLLANNGMPNYFGAQRFGTIEGNLDDAYELIFGEKTVSKKRLHHMLIASYQAHMFNGWLAKRIALSLEQKSAKPSFTLLNGDLCIEQTTQKLFTVSNVSKAQEDFLTKKIVPTGLMPGKKVWRARHEAYDIEALFDVGEIYEKGFRRPALVYPHETTFAYDAKSAKVTLEFSLPKSAYATVLIENLALLPLKTVESEV